MRKHCVALAVAISVLSSGSLLAGPTLDVGLLISEADETVSYAGWPLLFEVSFANQGAMNDWLYNQEIEAELAALEESVASGDLTEAEAKGVRETFVLREIEPVVFGETSLPWMELVSFQSSDGELPWAIELLAEDVPPSLVLGETGAAVAWYGLAAGASAALAPGVYSVYIVVSTDGIAPLPDGMWSGTSVSSPVRVEIRAEPDPSDELLLSKGIVFGRYELYRGEFETAKAYLLDAVALDPTSTEAWALLGVTRYALGELEEALESFYEALDIEWEKPAGPNEVGEPPDYLLFWIGRIQGELGLTPKPAGDS